MSKTSSNSTIQSAIADSYMDLSGALRTAADFLADNKFDVATRSLRSIASESGLSPTSFSRLARALGFQDYESLRDQARGELAQSTERFSNKARQLRDSADQPLLPNQVNACVANIEALLHSTSVAELEAAVDTLDKARSVTVIGALSSAGFADFFAYLVSWFDGSWSVAGRNGTTLASSIMRLTKDDAVIVISKAPYAKRSVLATELAAERGAKIVVLTDSHTFPALKQADHVFIQQIDSPQFFASYAATLVLIETIAGMLVARAGQNAENEIQNVIEQNQQLGEFHSPQQA